MITARELQSVPIALDPIARKSLVRPRFAFIDGLRGIAALSVVLFHLGRDYLGISALYYGHHGVTIFFVISGFVICHAMNGSDVTVSYFWRFLARRSLRLDPPYWISIAIAIAVAYVPLKILGSEAPLPSARVVLLHLFYLQDIAEVEPINVVFWTLCYEFQFYIVFALILWALGRLTRSSRFALGLITNIRVFSLLLPFSLFWPIELATVSPPGLFINLWYLFLMGAIARWAMQDALALFSLGIVCMFLAAAWSLDAINDRALVAVGTALAIVAAARLGRLDYWLNQRSIQYFGVISYSLYLMHDIVGVYVRSLGRHFSDKYLGIDGYWSDVVWVFVAIAASIGAAHLLYRVVEAPSIRLSKSITTRHAQSA